MFRAAPAMILCEISARRRISFPLRIISQARRCLLTWSMGHRLRITVDDDVLEGDYLIATVCNGVAYGGGFRAAPMADLQDGVLDVIMVKKMSRMRIAGVLSKYKNGLHYQNGRVVPELSDVLEYRRAQKVLIEPMDGKAVITNIDGECTPADSLSAQVLPLAARFVLPAPLYAQFEDRAPAVTA